MSQTSVSRRYPNRDNNNASLYNDLIQTQTYLETLQTDQSRLARHFVWCKHRQSTIDTVDGLQKKIDAIFVGSNVARGVGAAAGIVGIGAWFVGAVLEAKGYKGAAQAFRTSQLCAGASAATLTTSTLLEFGLTRSSMNEIKRVIKRDVELTESLQESIQGSHQVESLFYRMFQSNILSTTFINIMKVCGHGIAMFDAGLVDIDHLIRDLQSCKMRGMEGLQLEVSQKVLKFFRSVQKNPRVLAPMKAICKILNETPDISQYVKLASDVYWMGFQIKASGSLSEIMSLTGVGYFDFKSCVLNAAVMVSHIVDFILAVKNVQEGKSEYSESLDKLKLALNMELEEITKKFSGRFRLGNIKHADILELRNLQLS